MNGDKVVERDKILQVMEKYRDYFKEWNADVAFGTNKSNIFYVLAPRNEFETFLFFQTADQLERIILGTIAENVEIIMEAGIEEISIGFSADKMDGEYGKSIEHYLPGLVHKLFFRYFRADIFQRVKCYPHHILPFLSGLADTEKCVKSFKETGGMELLII